MRLDFNVLWIDDQPGSVASYFEDLEPEFEDEGFQLNITQALSVAEAESYIGTNVFLDEIDLVVVDYDLGRSEPGDVAVRKIRAKVAYKDIIFYSADPPALLASKMTSQEVAGVYFAHRKTVHERVLGIFHSLIKKVLDIDNCRGLVMGETSDMDHIINESLGKLLTKISTDHSTTSAEYALGKVIKLLAEVQGVHDSHGEENWLVALLGNHKTFTTVDKIDLLRKVMSLHYGKQHSDLVWQLGQYREKIPPKRNELGHVRLVAKDSIRSLEGSGARPKSIEEMRELRKSLLTYRPIFEELLRVVNE